MNKVDLAKQILKMIESHGKDYGIQLPLDFEIEDFPEIHVRCEKKVYVIEVKGNL